jgi:hypothetical protein
MARVLNAAQRKNRLFKKGEKHNERACFPTV